MGRSVKLVVDSGVDRRESGYYSTPPFVGKFLTQELLRISPHGQTVLDPCVGKEELLEEFYLAGKNIDSFDIEDFGVHERAQFRQLDFLEFFGDRFATQSGDSNKNAANMSQSGVPELHYDYYIANPPYNCHETSYVRANKKALQQLFPEIGVTNMYSMFMSALISLAKEGALIGLVTFDSFLTAGMHAGLRQQILRECAVHAIILCPTDLFHAQKADVRTCLLVLQKGARHQREITVSNRPASTKQFQVELKERIFKSSPLNDCVLLPECDKGEFVIGCPPEVKKLFELPRLGQQYKCVTGISTGNDRKYISPEQTDNFSVPFYKNPGSRKFFCAPDGYLPENFLEIEQAVDNFMVRNKDLLFRQGITCSSMGVPFSACYLPPQSTYGVNANIIAAPDDTWWLLAYLNSTLVTYFVRGVLIRTNMITSGYVSRIPIVPLCESTKESIGMVAQQAYRNLSSGADARTIQSAMQTIDEHIFNECSFSSATIQHLTRFCANLLRLT